MEPMTRNDTTTVRLSVWPFVALQLFVASLFTPLPIQAEVHNITIGTGGKTGVYYPVGQAICKGLTIRQQKYAIRCEAPSTQARWTTSTPCATASVTSVWCNPIFSTMP